MDLSCLQALAAGVAGCQLTLLPFAGLPAEPFAGTVHVWAGAHLHEGVGGGTRLTVHAGSSDDGSVSLLQGKTETVVRRGADRRRTAGPLGPRGHDTVVGAGNVTFHGLPGSRLARTMERCID